MAQVIFERESSSVYGGEDEHQKFTEDGTVDLKGKPVLRSKTGRWRACSFIVVYEVFERLAYQGIQSNLVVYLTREFHQGTVTASNNVTNWAGAAWMTPVLGAIVADAHLGRYWTFLISAAIYFLGMLMVTVAVSISGQKPSPCAKADGEECIAKASSLQVGLFFLGLYIIVVGNGGTKPNISTLGAEQFDEFEPREKAQKLSFFNWWVFSIFFGFLISETFMVYIQDNVGWSLGYGLPTLVLGVSILVFAIGTPFYRHRVVSGSSFTKMLKVIVAALRKWNVLLPVDSKELYELSFEDYIKSGTNQIDHTHSLRFLDKAAAKNGSNTSSEWTLRPVTEVEETKKIVKLIPVLIATFVPAIISSQSHTLFVKQSMTLDRSLGPHFTIPPACLAVATTLTLMIGLVVYDRLFIPTLKRYTGNPRGISMLQRLGTGIVLNMLVSATACWAEKERLGVARAHGIVEKNRIVPLSVFILLPQFILLGIADVFLEVSKQEFFYDQAPEGMKSVGASFFCVSRGIGSFMSSAVLRAVSDATQRNGRSGWVSNNLNVSHLDHFYAFLAVLASLNFLFFLVIAKSFVYNVEAKKTLSKIVQ